MGRNVSVEDSILLLVHVVLACNSDFRFFQSWVSFIFSCMVWGKVSLFIFSISSYTALSVCAVAEEIKNGVGKWCKIKQLPEHCCHTNVDCVNSWRVPNQLIEGSLNNSYHTEELKLEINFVSLKVKFQEKVCRAAKPQMWKQKHQTGLKRIGFNCCYCPFCWHDCSLFPASCSER